MVNGVGAWSLAKGLAPTRPAGVAVADLFHCGYTGGNIHPDLAGKLQYVECTANTDPHGIYVSGHAGANTDNDQYLASLGWKADLYGFRIGTTGLLNLIDSQLDPAHPANGKVDVVNNSWVTWGSPSADLRDAVRTLITMGIVVVGSAGNGQGCQDTDGDGEPNVCTIPQYPAAFAFDDIDDGSGGTYDAQVIAVSGSFEADSMRYDYTYSPGTDPLANAEQAFIDVAAPGQAVKSLRTRIVGGSPVHDVINTWGTSLAGPIVAAQVALVMSVAPTLRVDEVYEVVTRSTDKIDQTRHPDIFTWTDSQTGETLSWNQWSGYGRINAGASIEYALDRFGGTIGGSGETLVLNSDRPVASGTTLEVRSGTTIEAASGVRFLVSGTLDMSNTDIDASNPAQGWGGVRFNSGSDGTIANSSLLNVSGGAGGAAVYTNGSTPLIDNTVIDVKPGSYVFGVYSNGSGGARIVDSDITSASGPAINASYGAYISLYESTVTQTSGSTAVLATGSSAQVAFWPPPASAPYVGYDRIHGGRLRATGGGIVNAGSASSTTSQNHFCDADAATLEVQSGGTIYARYNYWPNGNGPTSITGSGTIYYSNNLGAAQCGPQPLAGSPGTSGKAAEAIPPAEAALFDALDARRDGNHAEARRLLERAYALGGRAAATALAEMARTHEVSGLAGIERFLEEKAAEADNPLRAEALAALSQVRVHQDRPEDAATLLHAAADLRTDDETAFHERLSAAYIQMEAKDLAGARASLARVAPTTEEGELAVAMATDLHASLTDVQLASAAARPDAAAPTSAAARGLTLDRPYPNPTSDAFRVRLAVADAAHVTVEVYDISGRRIARLLDRNVEAGETTLSFDASAISPGLYLVRAQSVAPDGQAQRAVRRITVVR